MRAPAGHATAVATRARAARRETQQPPLSAAHAPRNGIVPLWPIRAVPGAGHAGAQRDPLLHPGARRGPRRQRFGPCDRGTLLPSDGPAMAGRPVRASRSGMKALVPRLSSGSAGPVWQCRIRSSSPGRLGPGRALTPMRSPQRGPLGRTQRPSPPLRPLTETPPSQPPTIPPSPPPLALSRFVVPRSTGRPLSSGPPSSRDPTTVLTGRAVSRRPGAWTRPPPAAW